MIMITYFQYNISDKNYYNPPIPAQITTKKCWISFSFETR